MGTFPHKFATARGNKTCARSRKVMGFRNGKALLYHNAKFGGDRNVARRL